jgi:hypothetical protein
VDNQALNGLLQCQQLRPLVRVFFNSLNSDLLILDPASRCRVCQPDQSISKFRFASSTMLNHTSSTLSHSIFVSQGLSFSFLPFHSLLGQLHLTAMFLDVQKPPRFPYSQSVIHLHLSIVRFSFNAALLISSLLGVVFLNILLLIQSG